MRLRHNEKEIFEVFENAFLTFSEKCSIISWLKSKLKAATNLPNKNQNKHGYRVGATISTETHCIESYINRHDFKAEIFGDSPKISDKLRHSSSTLTKKHRFKLIFFFLLKFIFHIYRMNKQTFPVVLIYRNAINVWQKYKQSSPCLHGKCRGFTEYFRAIF